MAWSISLRVDVLEKKFCLSSCYWDSHSVFFLPFRILLKKDSLFFFRVGSEEHAQQWVESSFLVCVVCSLTTLPLAYSPSSSLSLPVNTLLHQERCGTITHQVPMREKDQFSTFFFLYISLLLYDDTFFASFSVNIFLFYFFSRFHLAVRKLV